MRVVMKVVVNLELEVTMKGSDEGDKGGWHAKWLILSCLRVFGDRQTH